MDLTMRVPRFPGPGETLAGDDFQIGFGGKGANQAVMAARLGARVSLVGRIGCDVFGDQTRVNLCQEGIDTEHVSVDEKHPTGVAAIVVDTSAENAIIIVPGANAKLSSDDVRRAASVIQAASVVLCQLEVPVETVLETFRIARAAGVTTILNPAPALELPDELLRLTDICIPNENELEVLTGQRLSSPEAIKGAAHHLLARGPKNVVVTLGAEGSLVVEAHRYQSFPAEKVLAVDTTGAGDAFIGSLAVYLAEGAPLAEAVKMANGVAALSVTRAGTQASFPNRDELRGLPAP